ncbi:hypothetical protein H632_c3306p1 [Helicosporidium sp. ATCC 50920]|nr:hypothetical protein H632_c3306p1 [Helicosporidium sp. ATCC 50920]|eukprot:KDD72466.1 hypothetical protein H632_c3306p1 [Helicosporidium sp. ATCC 50920]
MFRMKLVLGPDFPEAPPKGYFLTRIFHPNISETGEICVNVLKRDWTASMGLRHVLTVIRCLLVEPNAESALNEEAGRLLLEGFEDFARKARLWTSIHAQAPGILTPATGLLQAGNGALVDNAAAEGKDAKPAAKAKPGVKRGLKRL